MTGLRYWRGVKNLPDDVVVFNVECDGFFIVVDGDLHQYDYDKRRVVPLTDPDWLLPRDCFDVDDDYQLFLEHVLPKTDVELIVDYVRWRASQAASASRKNILMGVADNIEMGEWNVDND